MLAEDDALVEVWRLAASEAETARAQSEAAVREHGDKAKRAAMGLI